MKYFGFSWNYVFWEISFQNLMMLVKSIPEPKKIKEKETKAEKKSNSLEDFAKINGLWKK